MKATVRIIRGRIFSARRVFAVLAALLACVAASLAQPPANNLEGKEIADVVIQVQGNRTVHEQKIRNLLQSREGVKFSQAVLDEDVRRICESNYFRIQGRPVAWGQLRPDGKVDVRFHLQEYPTLVQQVQIKGYKHIKLEDLENRVAGAGVRKGTPLNPGANRKACHEILQHYHEKGFLLAHVELDKGGEEGDTHVVFNITEGTVAKVRSIVFEGNTFVADARLKTQIYSSQQWMRLLGGTFDPEKVDQDVLKLIDYYKSFGFHSVQVARELRWDPDQRHVDLIFHIQEGPQFTVASVSIEGNTIAKEGELLRFADWKPGEVYNQATVDKNVKNLTDYYGYRGHSSKIEPQIYYRHDSENNTVIPMVDVHYEIHERPPARVGEVYVIGNTRTKDRVIRNAIPLSPGQILSYPDLRVAEANLARRNIFENDPEKGIRPTVTVDESDPTSEYKDVYVHVREAPTGSFMLGLGINSDAGLTGSIVLNERNFDILRPPVSFEDLFSGRAWRGGGQEFRIEAVPGTQVQRYVMSWREPSLFDSPYSLGLSGYYYSRVYDEYTEERLGGRLSVGRKLNQYWNFTTAVRLEEVGISDVVPFAPWDFQSVRGDSTLVGLRAGLTRDSRDSFLRATEGSLMDFSFEQVLGDFTFPLASVDMNKYWTTYQRPDGSGRHVLAARTMMGVAGANAPVFERLYAGGFRTIRGFGFRGVGPDDNGFKVGGEFMFLNSLEYQVPVMANDRLYLVGFVDSGTVERSVEIKDYRVTAGVGARIVVPMLGPMPIALDFGFPIVKTDSDREQMFSFWIGFTSF